MAKVWTIRQALVCLIGSTLCTLMVSLGGYFFWSKAKQSRLHNREHSIRAIVQTGPEKEALKTAYLAELLGLSVDQETNLYGFDLKKGEQKLLTSPLIAEAKIRKIPPHALYIEYAVRHPIARLADYENIGLDRDGYLFPLSPFFSPKELPEIYLGLPPFGAEEDAMGRKGGLWQTPLKNRYLSLALEMLQFFEGSPWKEGMKVKRIDVSNAFAPSLGRREIVLCTEEELNIFREEGVTRATFPKILRLPTKDYAQQLANFFSLRQKILEDYRKQIAEAPELGTYARRIVDLRISQLAFVENP